MATDPNQPSGQTSPGSVTTGQATPPAQQQVALGLTPFETYTAMQQGYFGKLQGSAQPAMPQLDDPTMQALAQRIAALRDSHSVLSGQTPPDPNSVLARQTAHLSAAEIATQVGQQTWQQAI